MFNPVALYQLGDTVGCKNGRPLSYTIDGLRLEVKRYKEQWATDADDCPSTLHPEQPVWEYHLVRFGIDQHGNQTVNEWGWVPEPDIRPRPAAAPSEAGTAPTSEVLSGESRAQ